MSPSVVHEKFKQVFDERTQVLGQFRALADNLRYFGFHEVEVEEGRVFVGFDVPREIFDNSFDGFLSELRVLRFVMSTFSQIVLDETLTAELGQLSTSSPLVYFGVDFRLAAAFAACVTWSLDTWQRVQEIRDYRDLAPRIEALEGITSGFDDVIEAQVDAAIEEQIAFMQEEYDLGNVPEAELRKSLRIILERIERGMTVDFKMLEPPSEDASGEDGDEVQESTDTEGAILRRLHSNSVQLRFPKPSDNPVLQLTDNGERESKN